MKELDELIQDRKEKVRLMKKDGDNSHKLLAGLYGNPTHFITELLQNAEDEGAKHVSFELTENELIFSHDAPKLFDFNDIRAISNFGDNQEKKEKPNEIGRFGIGFKSVYAITDNPRIVSAEFDVTIRD
jgi:HSP90 family molecular chaperone